MARMWMSVPTPVTTSVINAESRSNFRSRGAPMPGIHYQMARYSVSPVPAKNGTAATAPTANEAPMASVASHPARGSRMKRPKKWRKTAPARGRAIASHRRSIMPSPLQLRQFVDGGGLAIAEDRHDDRQPDDDLGGGDDEDEEGGELAVESLQGPPGGHESQVDGVEHQLDAHEHHQGVAADEDAHRPDSEEGGGEQHVPVGHRPSSSRASTSERGKRGGVTL